MKAMICTRYGDDYAFSLQELPVPIPKKNELQIQIHATTVASGDVVRARRGGFLKSKTGILGQEFAGIVTAVGEAVTRYRLKDRVFGIVPTGTHAEYITVPENAAILIIPATISFDTAVTFPFGASAALHFLQKCGPISQGQQVLIHGASGAVGTFAVQYAKYRGAEVTGVCSTNNLDLVRDLGADHVIDYKQEDLRSSGATYDIIFNTTQADIPFATIKYLLKPNGIYATVSLNLKLVVQSIRSKLFGNRKVICGIASSSAKDLQVVSDMQVQGALKGVIDSKYPLIELAKAFRYVEQGHKTGAVIILPRS